MNKICLDEKLIANNKNYKGCKINSYGDTKEIIMIEPVSFKELHSILPIDYKNHLSDIIVNTIGDLFKMLDKVFNEHKMDSTEITLYFCTNTKWYKIILKDFININELEALDFYKNKIASYFHVK
jgi:hypothetical protein